MDLHKKIAFVTSSLTPHITADDMLLANALNDAGFSCVATPWDDPSVNWKEFAKIIVRSCWNYHLIPDLFQRWLIEMEKSPLYNSAKMIRWNMNKQYLFELREKGVSVPEAKLFYNVENFRIELSETLRRNRWNRAVLKPCISASSYLTRIITSADLSEEDDVLERSFSPGGMIVQEFMDVIPDKGELSLIFIKGTFSHAVIKTAKPGEFRVQTEFGGRYEAISLSSSIISQAEQILGVLPEVPLYARVDGVDVQGQFYLMELELIEPVLFLSSASAAIKLLAESIRST